MFFLHKRRLAPAVDTMSLFGYMEHDLESGLHKDITYVDFSSRHTQMCNMELVIQHCPKLESVCLSDPHAKECLARLCQHYGQQLRTVQLTNTKVPFAALAQHASNLHSLELSDCTVTDAHVSRMGQCFPRLRILRLQFLDITDLRPLGGCRNLKELYVDGLENVPRESWVGLLKQLPLLECLMLVDCTNITLETIVDAAGHNLRFFSSDKTFDGECARRASRKWSKLRELFGNVTSDARFEFRRCPLLNMICWRTWFQKAQEVCQLCRALAQSQVLRQRFGQDLDLVIVGYLGEFAVEDYLHA